MGFHRSSGNTSEATFLHQEYFFNPEFSDICVIAILSLWRDVRPTSSEWEFDLKYIQCSKELNQLFTCTLSTGGTHSTKCSSNAWPLRDCETTTESWSSP